MSLISNYLRRTDTQHWYRDELRVRSRYFKYSKENGRGVNAYGHSYDQSHQTRLWAERTQNPHYE